MHRASVDLNVRTCMKLRAMRSARSTARALPLTVPICSPARTLSPSLRLQCPSIAPPHAAKTASAMASPARTPSALHRNDAEAAALSGILQQRSGCQRSAAAQVTIDLGLGSCEVRLLPAPCAHRAYTFNTRRVRGQARGVAEARVIFEECRLEHLQARCTWNLHAWPCSLQACYENTVLMQDGADRARTKRSQDHTSIF